MAFKIQPQPWMSAPETKAVVAALGAQGTSVRFVGGCVRDAVIGRSADDIDIATPDSPSVVVELLGSAGIAFHPTGVEHGTVTAIVGGRKFQITSLRMDVETNGRHAKVLFTRDWALDARRRDFTINALFSALDGTVYDPFGGVGDLRAGRVRFVGNPIDRMNEDVLRMLRFFRFFAHYGRPPADMKALIACRSMVGSLPSLSRERIRDEFLKLLCARDPASTLSLMRKYRILDHVLPEATRLDRLRALSVIGTEYQERFRIGPDPIRRLGAVVDADAKGAASIGKSLRLPKLDTQRLARMLTPAHTIAEDSDKKAQRQCLYLLGKETFIDVVCLTWAEQLSDRYQRWEGLAKHFRPMLAYAKDWVAPKLPVDGNDAIAAGVTEGPEVAKVLKKVERWWLAGDFQAGRDAALEKLAEYARRNG